MNLALSLRGNFEEWLIRTLRKAHDRQANHFGWFLLFVLAVGTVGLLDWVRLEGVSFLKKLIHPLQLGIKLGLLLVVGGFGLFVWIPNNVPIGTVHWEDYMSEGARGPWYNPMGIMAGATQLHVLQGKQVRISGMDLRPSGQNMLVLIYNTQNWLYNGVEVDQISAPRTTSVFYRIHRSGLASMSTPVVNELIDRHYPMCRDEAGSTTCDGFQLVVIHNGDIVQNRIVTWRETHHVRTMGWSWIGLLNGRDPYDNLYFGHPNV